MYLKVLVYVSIQVEKLVAGLRLRKEKCPL